MTDQPRFMLIGPIAAGKSTLFQALLGRKEVVYKTQSLEFAPEGIDTPGEFFSHPRMYHALIHTSSDVDTIVYVHPCDERELRIPPGLLEVYAGKRLIAVISKTDCPECDPERTEKLLRQYGFNGPIFRVSARDPDSLTPLREFLLDRLPAADPTARSAPS